MTIRTRLIGSTTDTYSYAGTSESVIRIATSGVTDPVDSAVDAAGNRLGIRQGASAFAWLLPDLHGNVAAQLDSSASSVAYAIRYDPWGEIVDTGPGTTSGTSGATWTYQGRLDLNPPGAAEPLLDGGARLYSPGLGAFTGLDSVSGGVADPLSMNRYLYAEANPSTFIDPTGHCTHYFDGYCSDHAAGGMTARQSAQRRAYYQKLNPTCSPSAWSSAGRRGTRRRRESGLPDSAAVRRSPDRTD